MNVFRRDFKCYLTANRGKIRIEDTVGRPRPKDARLTGNVVVHILPEAGSDIKEGFIYFDDVDFISEESQFSTTGPVKYVSQNAQMLGKGMKLVYNDELDRLEFLKIIHLKSLRLKTSPEAGLFSSEETGKTDVDTPAEASSRTQTEQQAELVAADIPQETKPTLTAKQPAVEQREGEYYRAAFRNNVVIDSPEQLIFADEVSINNIFRANASSKKSTKAETGGTDNAKTPAEISKISATSVQSTDTISADSARASNVPVTRWSEPKELDEQFGNIAVTCDSGIVVTPMNSARKLDAIEFNRKTLQNSNDTSGRPALVAQKIDYSATTENAIASGPSELTFYVADIMGAESNETKVPVKVTAQEKARFLPALNQVVFEGDSLCTMLRENPNSQQKYTLSAPKLTINLSKDEDRGFSDIEHLTASGGVVQLDTSKWTGEKLLGFTKLKCRKFDYDAGWQMFLATGPDGIIAVDNSKTPKPEKKVGKFSLRRPCYVVVRNFETMKYFLEANRIIADTGREQMLIDYFPIVQGQYGQQITATAGHIEALLHETADGRNELSTLNATGGVTYEEEAKKKKWGKGKAVQFVGSNFFYDADKSVITAWGDEFQPCFLNGALVDGIEYNLKTERIKTKITGPGMLQMER
jgi:hypothetical protein